MNKLKELITTLCPEGLEFKELCEVCEFHRGTPLTSSHAMKGDVPVVSGGQKPAFYHNVSNRPAGCVTVAASGSAGYVSYWDVPIFCADSFTVDTKDSMELLSKFLYYYLTTQQEKIYRCRTNGAIPHVYSRHIANFMIPIPPLEVQAEIVRILDKFANAKTGLIALLERELVLRKKQFEYYRDDFLSKSTDQATLEEVAQYSAYRINAAEVDENNYVGVDNLLKDKAGKTKSNYVPTEGRLTAYKKNDILIGNIRPYLRKVWFADIDGGASGDVLTITVTDTERVYPHFLYYVLSSEDFFFYATQYSKIGKMPRGDKKAIMKYKFSLPSRDEQKRIAEILSRFETLCNSLTEGIPAEIEARKKQYAYYRDKLLTFKQKNSPKP